VTVRGADPLLSVDELAALLDIGEAKVADTRWYLGEPERGREAYDEGHISGAVYVNLEKHMSGEHGPGRHPLPSRSNFAATMGMLGFGDDDLVVAYDDRGGAIAARLWWILRDIGHHEVRVLDGGLPAWVSAGHLVDTTPPSPEPSTMTVKPSMTRTIDREALAESLGEITLVDARSMERYRGDEEPLDPIAGHIPTAVNVPYTENVDTEGHFLPARMLSARYRSVGARGPDTVVYCGSGVTACHSALAMVAAGLEEPILYPGSWSDWSTADMPVATGDEPGEALPY
jgi:thiosulfate/3-mercaptopyruvate sulfurtransferase